MAWLLLIIGGLCEVGWLIGLKNVNGVTRILPWIVTIGFMAASIGCLGLAIRTIPMGTAYAVWTGTSIASVTVVGIMFFHEPTDLIRLGSIVLIVLGIVGLRVQSS
jgi:quaternary ammonium compound-resistance protein SugE